MPKQEANPSDPATLPDHLLYSAFRWLLHADVSLLPPSKPWPAHLPHSSFHLIQPYISSVDYRVEPGYRDKSDGIMDNLGLAFRFPGGGNFLCSKRSRTALGSNQPPTECVHSCQQKSIDLKFSRSQTGSDVRYICHHNSSRFTFPIFAHSCLFSVLHTLQSITPRIY